MYEDEIPIGRAFDLRGKKFHKLKVLYRVANKNNATMWKCQCDCGNITITSTHQLRSERTKSCGCWRSEVKRIDLTNQTFGKLTALYPTDKRRGNHIIWMCKCECGNDFEAPSGMLTFGHVKSCGCLSSNGEEKISQILNDNNIIFQKQKTFNTCRFDDTNALARFDFYINEKYLIEFDGKQHFISGSGLYDNEKKFQQTQNHDAYKNQWCKDNNIPLIRIPYTKLDTLCLEDLMLETTQFRVV